MPKSSQPVEINTFIGGLVTEASPLVFPPSASVDEDNCLLNRDGSRDRRLGIDLEQGYTVNSTGIAPAASLDTSFTSFNWKNAGGNAESELLVLQVADTLYFYGMDSAPYSSNLITSVSGVASATSKCSYASVDGTLVVATGQKEVEIFEYDGSSITRSQKSLLIRDRFGVGDIDPDTGENLKEGTGINRRPRTLTNEHIYNLRNQTWKFPYLNVVNFEQGNRDTLGQFISASNQLNGLGIYYAPSNADATIDFLRIEPEIELGTLGYDAKAHLNGAVPSTPAPSGAFIIDAMERGKSRLEEIAKYAAETKAPIEFPITDLPIDTTPGGPSVITEAAGRIFYGGFSGEVIGGDSDSPKMSSYILFSQIVNDPADINSCFQAGDPTTVDAPDLLASDGGFVRIAGCYGIKSLRNLDEGVVVIAENGVWNLRGGSDFGFAADNFQQVKISSNGCISRDSIVEVEGAIFYWGLDGVNQVSKDQFGNLVVKNVSSERVKSFYDNIPAVDKERSKGVYDPFDRKIRWLYGNHLGSTAAVRELVFDLDLGAIYPTTIQNLDTNNPRVVSAFNVPPFTVNSVSEGVTVGGASVTVSAVEVTTTTSIRSSSTQGVYYLVLTSSSPTISFSFASYTDIKFRDWFSVDGVGKDAAAYAVAGWLTGNESQRKKQTKHLVVHCKRTEDGFEPDGQGGIQPTGQSSVMVQAQWDWANSANSGKWGTPFQAYKYKRHYFPVDVNDPYDYGFLTIVTKNKLRGRGRALSLRFSSEPLKDFRLQGWALDLGVNNAP